MFFVATLLVVLVKMIELFFFGIFFGRRIWVVLKVSPSNVGVCMIPVMPCFPDSVFDLFVRHRNLELDKLTLTVTANVIIRYEASMVGAIAHGLVTLVGC